MVSSSSSHSFLKLCALIYRFSAGQPALLLSWRIINSFEVFILSLHVAFSYCFSDAWPIFLIFQVCCIVSSIFQGSILRAQTSILSLQSRHAVSNPIMGRLTVNPTSLQTWLNALLAFPQGLNSPFENSEIQLVPASLVPGKPFCCSKIQSFDSGTSHETKCL